MIAAHRRRHRLIFLFVGPALVAFFLAALNSRPSPPTMADLPSLAHASAVSSAHRVPGALGEGEVIYRREDLFPGWPARVIAYLGDKQGREQSREIELKPLRPLAAPDVLLYWAPAVADSALGDDAAQSAPRLPLDAHLLGRIGGTERRRFVLPDHDVPAESGALILYSLGHQVVIAKASLPSFGAGGDQ
jgi:hypothetical protein